jgi:hypothetical protein
MKLLINRYIVSFLSFSLLIFNFPLISFAKTRKKQVRFRGGIKAEWNFYAQNYTEAINFFETIKQKGDKNYALVNNQLGSIYLTTKNYKKALDSFLEAYYLMNDVDAFKNLESKAISLIGAEAEKAYKGDPYEKLYNSLYTGLLLYKEGENDNALAAFKNGILCDSDVKADLYQSDAYILYLMASRLALKMGKKDLSKKYFKKASNAFYLTRPINQRLAMKKQAQLFLLKDKKKEIDKLKNPEKYSKKKKKKKEGFIIQGKEMEDSKEKTYQEAPLSQRTLDKIENIKNEIKKVDKNIDKLESKLNKNKKDIDINFLKKFIDLKNNVLLCIEFGNSPLKYAVGKYGELAVFTIKPSVIRNIEITVNNRKIFQSVSPLSSDVYFQAITRGGREMDYILKDQAQFKQTTAEMSMAMSRVSQNVLNQANQMAMQNPYYNPSGAYAAAGVIALIGLCSALASAASNPAADVRHWSFLPGNLAILPITLNPGNHSLNVKIESRTGNILKDEDVKLEIKENKDNIIFHRIFIN